MPKNSKTETAKIDAIIDAPKDVGLTTKRGKGVKQTVDREKLKEGIAEGMSFAEAAKYAGSQAKTTSALSGVTANLLARDKKLKNGIIEKMEEKREMALDAMTKAKFATSSLSQLGIVAGILTDKLRAEKGEETAPQRVEINFNGMTTEQLKLTLIQSIKES